MLFEVVAFDFHLIAVASILSISMHRSTKIWLPPTHQQHSIPITSCSLVFQGLLVGNSYVELLETVLELLAEDSFGLL